MKNYLPDKLFLKTMTGILIGLMIVLSIIFDATLIFPGPLNIYLLNAMQALLISGTVLLIIVPVLSSYGFVLGSVQETTIAILLVAIPSIGASVAAINPHLNPLPTIFAGILLSGIVTGLMLFLLGYLKVGEFISFLPYPVMAGFLAGTGGLLFWGAWPVMLGRNLALADLNTLLSWSSLIQWVPGMLLGIALLLVTKSRPSLIYSLSTFSLIVFYLVLTGFNISLERAGDMGLLLGPFKKTSLRESISLLEYGNIQWGILKQNIGSLLALMVLTPIAMLLTVSSLELETGKEFDLNRELKASGSANILSGFLGGGVVGYTALIISLLNYKCGKQPFITIFFAALVCVIALIFGVSWVGILPRFIFAGLLIYIGLSFLHSWLIKTVLYFSFWDYLVVWLIFLIIMMRDFLQGIVAGIITALIIFVIKYSRTKVIKFAMSGRFRCSSVERDRLTQKKLNSYSDEIYVYELQGYLFFGNGNHILKHVVALTNLKQGNKIKYLVLDFKDVQGIDSSCIRSFIKIHNKCVESQAILVLTNMSRRTKALFHKQTNFFDLVEHCTYFEDLDHGLEWCENNILKEQLNDNQTSLSLKEQLRKYAKDDRVVDELFLWLKKIEISQGDYLFKKGDPSDSMFFLDSGVVEVSIEDLKGKSMRLRTMSAGTFVGETGLYLRTPRGANVIAKEKCCLYRLDLDDFNQLQRDNPQIAAMLHGYVSYHLMERLNYANELIRMLLYSQED